VTCVTRAAGKPKEDAGVALSLGFGSPRPQDKSMVTVGKCPHACMNSNQEQWSRSQLLVWKPSEMLLGSLTAGMVLPPLCRFSLVPARGFTQGSARHSGMSPTVSREECGREQARGRTEAFLCNFGMSSPGR